MRHVLLTRALEETQAWTLGLHGAGFQVIHIPLIDIQPAPHIERVCAALEQLDRYRAVMFVSVHAVAGFWQGFARLDQHGAQRIHDAGLRCWVTGPGTRQALLALGVEASCIDAPDASAPQLDSESLWQAAGHHLRPSDRVLIVRGTDDPSFETEASKEPYSTGFSAATAMGMGRNWLSERILAASAHVDYVVGYARLKPQWNLERLQQVADWAKDGSVWVFSSSQAVKNLQFCCPNQSWRLALALATHPRIAQAVRDAGFEQVMQAKPVVGELLRCLQSLD
jgi:uroporphyrinogen-III synthase